MVRFGLATWMLDEPGPAALDTAARLGLSCVQVEYAAPGLAHHAGDPAVRESYRRARERTGVAIVGMGAKAVNDLGMTAPAGTPAHDRCRAVMHGAIDAAADLEIPLVFFPSFRASQIHDDEGLRHTARLLREACRRAADQGLCVGSENTLGAEGNHRLVDVVDAPNFRVILDSFNPTLFGHRVPPLLEALHGHIADQVHAKDGVGGRMGSAPLGTGEGRFDETMAALRTLGFSGCILLENDYRGAAHRIPADLDTLARHFPPGEPRP
ncbi:sugar phosphate isomerase/epimerase family protein [Archangium violaceum]|uniref:sugar phosphate isomerase/epimerase family protein n=1 Tax=Archangium violaceum TaxID=83451 RepID=UPI001EEFA8A8|nr:sugar phosphate isomerase/epimerase family protein [Archangium violaceum]